VIVSLLLFLSISIPNGDAYFGISTLGLYGRGIYGIGGSGLYGMGLYGLGWK